MPPLQQFLSIFDHRMISLYYRVWEKYRAGLATERSGRELVSLALLASIGLASPGLQDRLKDVPDRALCYYAGLLSQRPRAAATLEQLLADYFDVPVTVQPFAGVWRRLEPTVQCCLDGTETPSHQAGRGAVVGDEFWDQSSMVRVAIGPLSLDQYVRFLPQGDAYPALRSLTRLFGGDEFEFEVQLILRRRQIPLCRIGDSGKAGPRLGWLTWMPEGKRDGEVGDTLLRL
jgi:type VI secretion system protein ImpH